jgi:hypothetical protein
MPLLGHAHFSPDQVTRWQQAYVPPPSQRSLPSRLTTAWRQIFADPRYGYLLFPACAAALTFALIAGGGSPGSSSSLRGTTTFLFTLLALWLLFWISFTHLQSRFFILAIPAIALLISEIDKPQWRTTFIGAAVVQSLLAFVLLQPQVNARIGRYVAALGIDSLRVFQSDEHIQSVLESPGHVCLIGDARAFLYDVPMTHLHYRTVFDVDVRGRDLIDAWSDGCPRAPGDSIIIDYNELHRFAKTYYGIPTTAEDREGIHVVRVTE